MDIRNLLFQIINRNHFASINRPLFVTARKQEPFWDQINWLYPGASAHNNCQQAHIIWLGTANIRIDPHYLPVNCYSGIPAASISFLSAWVRPGGSCSCRNERISARTTPTNTNLVTKFSDRWLISVTMIIFQWILLFAEQRSDRGDSRSHNNTENIWYTTFTLAIS